MPRGRSKKSTGDTPSAKTAKEQKGNGGNLGFEAQLFLAADKLRKNLEPSDYKHVALGLIFLKYISNAFESKRAALLAEDAAAAEDRTSISPKGSFGCRRRHAGHTCKPTPSNRPSTS
jgi:type I restriction enzyme M protein